MGIPARLSAHIRKLAISVVKYMSVEDLFECPNIDEIVVIGTPFTSIFEAAECRIR